MVMAVVVVNLCLSLFGFWLAWKVWRLRGALADIADHLTAYERATHRGLSVSPPAILRARRGTASLRQQYQDLEPQVQRLEQLLGLMNAGLLTWRRSAGFRRSRFQARSKRKLS